MKDLDFLSNKFLSIIDLEISNENLVNTNIKMLLEIYTVDIYNTKKTIKILDINDLKTSLQISIDEFGKLLNEQWFLKKSLTKYISNEAIDDIYNSAINAGAMGGKLLGAGGGGFMLFYAKKENHKKIKESLKNKLIVPFRFEKTGSQIIYYSHD